MAGLASWASWPYGSEGLRAWPKGSQKRRLLASILDQSWPGPEPFWPEWVKKGQKWPFLTHFEPFLTSSGQEWLKTYAKSLRFWPGPDQVWPGWLRMAQNGHFDPSERSWPDRLKLARPVQVLRATLAILGYFGHFDPFSVKMAQNSKCRSEG